MIKEISKNYIDCFIDLHEKYGFESESSVAVSSGIDKSVYLIGSTISVLKPYLLEERGLINKKFLIQPAIRTQQLKNMENLKDNGSCYGSFFLAMGDLAPYVCLDEIFSMVIDYFISILDGDTRRVMFRVSSQDKDLMKYCMQYETISTIEIDSRQESYYRHHYGLDKQRIFGRNCNIAIAQKDGHEYRDVANIIVIENDGFPFAVEVAIGVSTLISHIYGFPHTMKGNLIADILEMKHTYAYWLGDCISVIACLEGEGVVPNSSRMQGRLLKKYRKVFDTLSIQMGYDEASKCNILANYGKYYTSFMDCYRLL